MNDLTLHRPGLNWHRSVPQAANDARRDAYRLRQAQAQRDPKTGKTTIYRHRLATRVLDGIQIQAELKHGPSITARALRVEARVRAELKAGAR